MKHILAAIVMLSITAPALGEEVLYCTDTAASGFKWDKGSVEPTLFDHERFIVKIISESTLLSSGRREITQTTGRVAGWRQKYWCDGPDKNRRIVCRGPAPGEPWIFHDNTFVHAFLAGPPAGDRDPNIFVSYGTCVKH